MLESGRLPESFTPATGALFTVAFPGVGELSIQQAPQEIKVDCGLDDCRFYGIALACWIIRKDPS
ncbi:MAG: hypothetical protein DMF24_08370 [Verrucomicrobia bacterium]|nr:MAG: hypothetical protein DMF24_08370 [Verrucomicrobiota bacterium]